MNNIILWIAIVIATLSMIFIIIILGMLMYMALKEDKKDNKKRGEK